MKKVIDFVKSVWVVWWWMSVSFIVWGPIFVTGFFSKTGKLAFRICQVWVWIAKGVTFTKIETVRNAEIDPKKSYVIVSNHQSLLDIPVLMLNSGLQFRWVLKKELGYIPMFGWALWGARHIFVDRSNPKRALKNMTEALKKLPEGVSVAVFPEGTRSDSGELGDFKIGGFLTAISAGLPVLPVTINGSWKRMPNKKSLAFYPGKIQLVIGEPIDTSQYSKREISKLMKAAKEAVAANLNSDYPEISK
ncbi:MAG: 1-acyl-sn-glycerol-3-phosphate acyltransferase [Deltaproteobacteria bacterium]|nr:1-acyl-sn-glycerol-3-phosphate acyltransferase [Deltaproteobacteria bacterium]MBN2670135.1 1-acyl-sn-glycerol-3-phosphate acyltransferase [Deltaproteobacteria bacterium]